MYLNLFSHDTSALDMTDTAEFKSLCSSADELGIARPTEVSYSSANTVLRHQRFHFLHWGTSGSLPVLFLHGSNQSAHSWDLVSLNLCAEHEVFALDQRGHGDSEWHRGANYEMPEMAADAAAFIEHHIQQPAVVVGHSMGGMVTMNLAVEHPEMVKAAVIVDMGPDVSDQGRKMIREFVGRNIEFDDMNTFLDRVVEYDPYRTREHIERTLKYNLIRRADGKYVTKADRRRFLDGKGSGIPSAERLAEIECPVYVVRGADSNILLREPAERFAQSLKQGKFTEVANCGHNVASQNTPGLLEVLRPFLHEIDALP